MEPGSSVPSHGQAGAGLNGKAADVRQTGFESWPWCFCVTWDPTLNISWPVFPPVSLLHTAAAWRVAMGVKKEHRGSDTSQTG